MRNLQKIWILLSVLVVLLFSGCAPDGSVTEPAPSDDNSNVETVSPSPVTEEVLSTPSPSSLPVATETETAVATNTDNLSGSPQLTQTPVHEIPVSPKTTPVDSGENIATFLIRSLNTEENLSFEELAVERSKEHLAQTLQISVDEISLTRIDRAELRNNNVCQNPTASTKGAENDGITLGYEILLMADSQQHHYAILHNLGYYCGT